MKSDKEVIEKLIAYHKERLEVWENKLNVYMLEEYDLRRAKNLEVQGDYKDLERASKASKILREAPKND